MSLTNTIKEVVLGVQSTKFFNESNSFEEMKSHLSDPDLFTMTQNQGFVALSNFVKPDGKTLDVDWYTDT